jgi:SAM-dependent methyltransferase
MALYDDISRYYAAEYESFDDDIELYLQYARLTGSPILDIACGTGRVGIALAGAGYDVTGLDNSAAMLQIAGDESQSEELRGSVRFVHGDMVDDIAEAGTGYALAVVPLGSFTHIPDNNRQVSALRSIYRALRPGGLLMIDMPNALTHLYPPSAGEMVYQATFEVDGRQIMKFVSRHTDAAAQTEDVLLVFDGLSEDGTLRRRSAGMKLRYLFRYEMELLLDKAGFTVQDVFGSYEMTDYSSDDERMIFVARKPG